MGCHGCPLPGTFQTTQPSHWHSFCASQQQQLENPELVRKQLTAQRAKEFMRALRVGCVNLQDETRTPLLKCSRMAIMGTLTLPYVHLFATVEH
jgi:hypothetical protein